jgi:hypothetical protein
VPSPITPEAGLTVIECELALNVTAVSAAGLKSSRTGVLFGTGSVRFDVTEFSVLADVITTLIV